MNEFVEVLEFEPDNNKEYKAEAIQDSTVADKHLLGLYYLVA